MSDNEGQYQKKLSLDSDFSMGVACWPVYTMLLGMSIELILKAIIVESGKNFVFTHDLVNCAKNADFFLTDEEKNILNLLTECITWDGSCPASVDKQKQHVTTCCTSESHLYDSQNKNETFFTSKNEDPLKWENLNALRNKMISQYTKISRMPVE
ncbi:MAG: hypothetical protein D3903_10600 [Candidatus Electrothrix sp. GM3_4]|nr:hypothetical protein [Candidatus Electrothrix sp. GM3_4]